MFCAFSQASRQIPIVSTFLDPQMISFLIIFIHLFIALRARLIELLQRRIGFSSVDDYIAQHPEAQRSMFSANSGNIAKATNARASVDGHDTMDILVRHLGPGISVQGLRKVVERELSKKPRGGDI